ncbi:hypothetical protein AX15_005402 [Amanita polypyramis BW_CC]|nr:hypothetical protein AX15_005402 [Amanita polypyramis BW_CC]
MLTILHRRPVRRSTLLVSFVVIVILLSAYTRRSSSYASFQKVSYKIPFRPYKVARTVTRTYTASLRTTQTVYFHHRLPANMEDRQVPNQIGASKKRPLEKHTYRPDGLLEVNPDGPHPIFKLIRDAEAAWEAKHSRASKTLEQAVREYRRRYRRDPPRGFDHW